MAFFERLAASLRKFNRQEEQILLSQEDINGSVERGAQRGIFDSRSDKLGILFSLSRMNLGLTINELSRLTGVAHEDIVDLELGSFNLPQGIEVAEKLKEKLEIGDSDFKKALLQSVVKK